jgi:hypothetical protein
VPTHPDVTGTPAPEPERVATSGTEPLPSPFWPPLPETIAVLGLILLAVGMLEGFYAQNPVPPGVDPGDWVQRSYAWVGLPHPPAYSVGSPFLYPPVIFPILGGLRLATGSPLLAGFAFAGLLLGLYGLTLWALARTALRLPAFRLALVGFGMLNGTVLSMLFWGGYPNFLAFSFVNLSLACLVLFLRRPAVVSGVLLWGFAAATYLTHTLTFDLLLGVVVLSFVFSLLLGRLRWRTLFHRGNLLGIGTLVGTVATYSVVTALLHIPRIDYLFSNPPTFTLVNIGLIFAPLAKAPTYVPMGPTVTLAPRVAVAILAAAGFGSLAVGTWLARSRPSRWGVPTLVGGAWLAVMLLAPVGGYFVHVDTDYSRFVYFLPLPLSFLILVGLEGAMPRDVVAAAAGRVEPETAVARSRGWRRPQPFRILSVGVVLLCLAALVVNVSIPTMAAAEQGDAGAAHDAAFLAATHYLASNPAPGSVLTTQSAARWTEALTARGAFDPGPTWLQFEPWEIVNAQEAFFATNTATAITNNLLVASYSGYATASLSQAPMLSALVLGVPVPIARVLPASESTNSAGTGCTGWTSAAADGSPTLTVPASSNLSGSIQEANPCATTVQTTTLSPDFPTLWLNYTITPTAGTQLFGFNVTLASPPSRVVALHTAAVSSIAAVGGSLTWDAITAIGQFPGGASVALNGLISPAPTSVASNATNGSGQVNYGFTNPTPSAPLSLSFEFSVPVASNPAVVLPSLLSTGQFFATNSIRFLLLPSTILYTQTIDFLSATFGFVTVFSNSEWTVLQSR